VNKKYLIVVVGPTAVGKTALSIKLAQAFNTSILSADSRQFYRQMKIGTAKPDAQELSQATHYFVDSLDIDNDYNVGRYEKEALELLDKLYQTKDVAILVGGSGLYVKALCDGIDEMPKIDPAIRERLNKEKEESGLDYLVNKLVELDPEYASIVDRNNPQRVIRALEVIESSGNTYSFYRKSGKVAVRPFEIVKIGLELPRELLYDRINTRMDQMIAAGLFDEAESLYDKRALNALQTVGYSEVFSFLAGEYDREEAVRLLKRNSRRYAKRQLTWFKKDNAINWFQPDRIDNILLYLKGLLDIKNIDKPE